MREMGGGRKKEIKGCRSVSQIEREGLKQNRERRSERETERYREREREGLQKRNVMLILKAPQLIFVHLLWFLTPSSLSVAE